MTKEETANYIEHHLTIAGRQETLLSDDAVELIHLTSRGLPRSVNNIAWQSLIAAFTEEKGIIVVRCWSRSHGGVRDAVRHGGRGARGFQLSQCL